MPGKGLKLPTAVSSILAVTKYIHVGQKYTYYAYYAYIGNFVSVYVWVCVYTHEGRGACGECVCVCVCVCVHVLWVCCFALCSYMNNHVHRALFENT